MKILDESNIAITGFSSVRERVLLQSREFFQHPADEQSFSGFGSLLYLANAWFTPYGFTGMHSHEGVDIVSIIPRGEIAHQGSIGDGERLLEGQVQIQRSGMKGFRHNEVNPTGQPQPFIQLWFLPEHSEEHARFEVINVVDQAQTVLYQSFDTTLSVLSVSAAGQWTWGGETLIFIYSGSAILDAEQQCLELERGMLINAKNPTLHSHSRLKHWC